MDPINNKYKYKFYVAKSPIHGQGIFAKELIKKYHPIGIGIYYKWYFYPEITCDFGALINHSYKTNAKLIYFNNTLYIFFVYVYILITYINKL